jgi:hypothetical protein
MLVLGATWAQNTSDSGNMPQLPVGQTFKQFEFPIYQEGKLKATLDATEARGITLNRAETTDLKIQIYDNGAVTTTITSPKADLYVNEQKMRTKNTVQIERTDLEATSQDCDFDLKTKKYLLRNNVKVLLKHFDLSLTPANGAAPPASTHTSTGVPPIPALPHPARNRDSLLSSPGSYADTNSAPIPPSSFDTK